LCCIIVERDRWIDLFIETTAITSGGIVVVSFDRSVAFRSIEKKNEGLQVTSDDAVE
jgi:hypothetical protein